MIDWIPILSLLIALLLVPVTVVWLDKRKQDKKCSLIITDERKNLWPLSIPLVGVGLLLFVLLALIGGCSSDPEQSSVSGAADEKITFPTFPNFPTLPAPPGGTVTVKPDTSTSSGTTTPVTTTPTTTTTTTTPATGKTEQCKYAGRFNGDRSTWYCSKKMSSYPTKITITIPTCITKTISNNGTRYESGGLIVKQSDVSGRGMAIVMASSCKSTSASVSY